jgi:hypothetical protein
MPIQSCGQSVSARRGKRYTEVDLFSQGRPPAAPWALAPTIVCNARSGRINHRRFLFGSSLR